MGKIYVNQDKLRLQLNTGVDLTGAQALKIRYQKPGSTAVNEFVATALPSLLGALYYDFKSGDLNKSGDWTFWPWVTFADGRSAPGQPIKIKVWDEGT
jgi:hypothetical protein